MGQLCFHFLQLWGRWRFGTSSVVVGQTVSACPQCPPASLVGLPCSTAVNLPAGSGNRVFPVEVFRDASPCVEMLSLGASGHHPSATNIYISWRWRWCGLSFEASCHISDIVLSACYVVVWSSMYTFGMKARPSHSDWPTWLPDSLTCAAGRVYS